MDQGGSDKADKKSEQSQVKDEGNVSGADDQEKAVSFGEKENEQSDEMPRQPAAYSPIDIRL